MSFVKEDMNSVRLMSLNKRFAFALTAVAVIFNLCFSAYADKISDYEFEKGESHLYVGNRSAKNCIAITFDDGPHPVYTRKILDILEKYDPELIVVVAYGKILPSYVLDYPKYGCINVHGSLLPK